MKTICFICFFAFFSISVKSQQIDFASLQKWSAHAASGKNEVDAMSLIGNPSTTIQLKGIYYGIFSEQKFLQKELNQSILFFGKTYKKSSFLFALNYFGYPESNVTETSLAMAKKISEKTNLALRFKLFSSHIKGYPNCIQAGTEISMNQEFSDVFKFGFSLSNPQSILFQQNKTKTDIGYRLKWGFLYDCTSNFNAFADVLMTENNKPDFVAGFAFHFNKKISCKYSVSFRDYSCRASFDFKVRKVNICTFLTCHQQLGIYPSTLLFINSNPTAL